MYAEINFENNARDQRPSETSMDESWISNWASIILLETYQRKASLRPSTITEMAVLLMNTTQ